MTSLLVSIVAAGFVGSLHCAGMCGGMVAFAAGGTGGGVARKALPHVSYHLSRGLGYAVIGAVAGLVGSAVDAVGAGLGMGRVAGVIAGTVMLAWGALRLLEAGGVTLRRLGVPKAFEDLLTKLVRAARARPPLLRASVTGACTAALPCGLLHAFTVVATGSGSALAGASIMGAFWLGTVPALVGLGAGVQAFTGRLRRHAELASALALVAVGLSSVSGHLSIPVPPPNVATPLSDTVICHGR
jgi:sulfite exporter TauE/SafE